MPDKAHLPASSNADRKGETELFDLEAALENWAAAMAKSRRVDERQREEMLDHLRLSVESWVDSGLTAESASQLRSASSVGQTRFQASIETGAGC